MESNIREPLMTCVVPACLTSGILDTVFSLSVFPAPFYFSPLLFPRFRPLLPHRPSAIYPATTLTPIGQTLPQPPQVIQQQQQREGEGERTLLLYTLHASRPV